MSVDLLSYFSQTICTCDVNIVS